MSTRNVASSPTRSGRGTRRVLVWLALPAVTTVAFWLVVAPESQPVRAISELREGSSRERLKRPTQRARVQRTLPAAASVEARPRPTTLAEADPPAEDVEDTAEEAVDEQDEPVATFEQIKERQAREQARLHERLEQRFTAQGIDPEWRRDAESRLSDGVHGIAGPGLQLESSSCREDVCKTHIAHEGTEIDGERLTRFIRATARGLEHHFKYEPGRTTVYSLRRD